MGVFRISFIFVILMVVILLGLWSFPVKAAYPYQSRCQYIGEGKLKTVTVEVAGSEVAVAFGGWLKIDNKTTGADGPWYYLFTKKGTVTATIASGGICVGPDAYDYVRLRECPQCNLWEAWDTPYCRIYKETGLNQTRKFQEVVSFGEVAVIDGRILWTVPAGRKPGAWLYVDYNQGLITHVINNGALCIGPREKVIQHRKQACSHCNLVD